MILGHEDLNTTQIYTRVSIKKLTEIHAATHPAGREGASKREVLLEALAVEQEEEALLDSAE
jgi:integrase/recombinase XerD